MKVRISKDVYTDGESVRSYKRLMRDIRKGDSLKTVYVITRPLSGIYGLYEIYSFRELLQSYYQDMSIEVLGMAASKPKAREIVNELIQHAVDAGEL